MREHKDFLNLDFIENGMDVIEKGILPGNYVFMNMHMVSEYALNTEGVRDALCNSSVFLDGAPIWFYLNKMKSRSYARVRGADFLRQFCESIDDKGSVFFIGSEDSVLNDLRENLDAGFGGCWERARYFSPKFGGAPEVYSDIERYLLNNDDARYIFLGLGCPKQEVVGDLIRKRFPGLSVFCVGAAFDFISGNKPEAPEFMQRVGVEWFYRLLSEPGRTFRRYTVNSYIAIAFLIKVYRG
ncbi:WecB/TagA/CpsF family glycosyltransferase [Spongiibacter tropicus]|uniref:WecB/TagA/CpsF family glycosyltransferase n=1 Tax=Spongiibacter tropicus TaxID=454602 RepID=UPI003A9A0C40